MLTTMPACPDAIRKLVDHFDRQSEQVRSVNYNETQLRVDFVNPFFRELGWDMDNTQRFAEQYREVVHEDRVKVGGSTKAPDYSFRIGGARKFFLEAKKTFVDLKQSGEPAYQLRRYGWSAKLAVSLTPNPIVDDGALRPILKRLYDPDSPYAFDVLSADILGSVYERFLGKIITLTEGHRARVEEKPEVRKAGGVYDTPTYIVDYIVKQTVGKLLGSVPECPAATPTEAGVNVGPTEAAKLKILDPACGSGSFLLGAYQYLLEWHLKWYLADGPEKWSRGKSATLRPAVRRLPSSLYRRCDCDGTSTRGRYGFRPSR